MHNSDLPTKHLEQPGKQRFAQLNPGYFDICIIFFVTLLVVANICGTKVIKLGPLVFDGGAITFPFTYVLGDVISEIYGLKAAKRAIKYGFLVSALAAIVFWIVGMAPVGPGYQDQDAFMTVLGFVPRILGASLLGYIFGEWLNAYVLVWIKERWGEKHLWVRLVGSTIVGELADTLIFCTVAFIGVIPGLEFLNYVVTGYVYKVAVEIIVLPITYQVIKYIKRREPSYYRTQS